MIRPLAASALVAALAGAAGAQTLMVVESTNDAVMLVDGFDGTLLNPLFIDLTVAAASTPIEARVVGTEIWISDQLLDGYMRFSLDGTTWLGNITGAIDNCRGFEVVGNETFLSNSGTGNGAPGDAVIVYDSAGTPVTSWVAGDPFDVLSYNGNLLIANIADEALDLHAPDGTFLSTFHDSDGVTGIDFPEQLAPGFGGNVLAAGFSTPSGVYEYDSTGAQINYYDTAALGGSGGLRGVYQLGNGNILHTSGSGVDILDPVNLTITTVVAGVSGRFISELEGGGPTGPGTALCFGDGSGSPCGCGNEASTPTGCLNTAGVGGSLAGTGTASVSGDTLSLTADNVINQPGLFFQGNNTIGGGVGSTFGDGIRCCGQSVVRIEVVNPPGTTSPATVDMTETATTNGPAGTVNPGDTKCYQYWYRDPAGGGVCGSSFNLTNAYEVTWSA